MAGVIHVTVIAGRELAAKDRSGKSDPYVVAQVMGGPGSSAKSPVQKKTLNPHYDWSVDLPYADVNTNILKITVWDWDRIGKDDFMGHIMMPVSTLVDNPIHKWMTLLTNEAAERVEGELHVKVELEKGAAPPVPASKSKSFLGKIKGAIVGDSSPASKKDTSVIDVAPPAAAPRPNFGVDPSLSPRTARSTLDAQLVQIDEKLVTLGRSVDQVDQLITMYKDNPAQAEVAAKQLEGLKDDQEWWKGQRIFVQGKIDDLASTQQQQSGGRRPLPSGPSGASPALCTLLWDFDASTDHEMSVAGGTKVTVIDGSDPVWWLVRTPDLVEGYVPANYLDVNNK